MNPKTPHEILDAAAAAHIPPTLDLTPQILARLRAERPKPMRPKLKFATVLVTVILALAVLTTAVYALYRWLGDPGLQAAEDAGLVTRLEVTAQPTRRPTVAPTLTPARLVYPALTQTQAGVTVTLDWVALDQNRLTLGLQASPLPSDATWGAPQLTFRGAASFQPQGYSLNSLPDGQIVIVSYQVIQAATVGLVLDLPLMQEDGPLATFRFDVSEAPLYPGQTLASDQTFSVRRDGVALRLQGVRFQANGVAVDLCADVPWTIAAAALAFDEGGGQTWSGVPSAADAFACQTVNFPNPNPAATRLTLSVTELSQASGETLAGPWAFYVTLPTLALRPGYVPPEPTAAPAPLGAQTLAEITLTLDWVFADAQRVAFGYTLRGLPETADAGYLGGAIHVVDAAGHPLGWGGSRVQPIIGEPGAYQGTWSETPEQPLTVDKITLAIDVTLDGSYGPNNWEHIIASIDYPEGASPFGPGSSPSVIPASLVGTFHFEVETEIYPLQRLAPGLSVSTNGIDMRLVRADLTPSYAHLIVCYPKPSAHDWTVGGSPTLQAESYTARLDQYGLIADADYGGYLGKGPAPTDLPPLAASERCVSLDFLLGRTAPAQTLTLTIPRLEQSMPEVIPDAELAQAQEKLRTQGIIVAYGSSSSAGGGGGGGPSFTQLPAGMDQTQAYEAWLTALDYLYPGPWVFTLTAP
jgi:hypothetical protein